MSQATRERNRIYSRVYRQVLAQGSDREQARFEAGQELARNGFVVYNLDS